jgi:hypothetical protein
MALRLWVGQDDLLWLYTSLDETLDAAVGVQGSSIDHTILHSLLVSEDVDQGSTNSQVLVKVWVVDAQNLVSAIKQAWGCDTSRGVVEGVKGLVLDTHTQDEGVVRDHCLIMEDDVLVRAVNINHSRVNNSDSRLKHKLFKLLSRVTGRVSLQILFLFNEMIVRKASWRNKYDVGELEVTDGKKCLDEGDACITSTNHNDSGILDNLWLREHTSGGEAKSEWCFVFVQRVS